MDGPVRQATGAGELDVIGAQHLEHLGAHQAHDQRQLKHRQRDGRQGDVLPALGRQQAGAPQTHLHHIAAPEAGQPAQHDGKNQDQQDADQEGGQRYAQQRNRHEQLAQEGATPKCRVHPHRNANEQGQEGRHQSQLQGGRQALDDQARDLGALTQAQAELAVDRIPQKVCVLHEKRLIQPQISPQLPDLVGRGVLAQQEHHRIAHILKQQEGNEGHRHHHQHGLEQSLNNEGEHSKSLCVEKTKPPRWAPALRSVHVTIS